MLSAVTLMHQSAKSSYESSERLLSVLFVSLTITHSLRFSAAITAVLNSRSTLVRNSASVDPVAVGVGDESL